MNATQSRSSSLEMEREKREAAQVATEANGETKKVVVGIDNTDQPKTPLGIFKYIFNWYPKSKYSKEEIWLLRKMDMTIVTFGAFAFFLKYLDSTNINNAYVSGMREDLKIDAKSNDYAWFGFYYYIGYMVLQIPTVLVISRPGIARWLLPGVELLWGVITFAQVRIQNVESVFAVRFILGALAIPSYTGVNYVLGSWYKGDELFKRSAVFMMGNSLGQMFSGYLMAAVYRLDGKAGLPGWRWLFVVDGIITVPIALISFAIFPGLPTDKARIWWLSAEEQELARKRMRDDGVAGTKKITVKGMLKIFSGWHLWVPVAMIIFFLIETYPAGQMTLWLKSLKNADGSPQYSIALINTIPTAIQAIIAVTTFLTGSLAGLFNIWYIIAFIQGVNLFAVVVLRIWTVPNGLKFAAYFMLGFMGAPNPIFFGWINRLTRRSAEERAVVLGAVFTFGWAFFAWVPLIAYRTPEAPRWTKGYSTAIACTILSTAVFFVGGYLHRREEQKYAKLEAAATDGDLAPAVADADRLSNYDEKEVPIHEEDVSRPTDGTMDREHATLPHTHQFSQTDREREAKILPQPNTTV